jgi:hypothetical protein
MSDAIDEMFTSDLSKLSMPSELAMNAAKVKAAQTDEEGAEKPDLYAKGKGKGKDGKPAKDEENDERKSKGPNKGDKKDPNAPDKSVGAKSKDDVKKEASMKPLTSKLLSKIAKPVDQPPEAKNTIDDDFNADMAQVVGMDVPELKSDFERPDVKLAGMAEDAIDMGYIGWMAKKASDDVVKEAISVKDAKKLYASGSVKDIVEAGKKAGRSGAGKGALAATGVIAAGVGAKKLHDKVTKTAGVIENPENLDLLGRIRKSAQGFTHGCSDV